MGYSGLYISDTDVDNWGSGAGNAEYKRVIDTVEAIFEKIVGRAFRPKSFDARMNGNNKNRIFLRLREPIQTVSGVWINGVALDPSWYSFDEDSVFVSPESGALDVDWNELFGVDEEYLFPRGYENIRFKGTTGPLAIPEWVKTVLIIMAKDRNDPELYTHYLASESIESYSYSMLSDLAQSKGLTGIKEADDILKHFRKRKPVICAP